MSNPFTIQVYEQDKDFNNFLCCPATIDWLGERLSNLSEKLGLSEEEFDETINIDTITANDILAGNLQNKETKPDIFFMPGGNSIKYTNSLGKDGAEAIREYLSNDGSFYGICAGAYYASEEIFSYSKDKETGKKSRKPRNTESEKPVSGTANCKADGDPQFYYGKNDPKISGGAYVGIKLQD